MSALLPRSSRRGRLPALHGVLSHCLAGEWRALSPSPRLPVLGGPRCCARFLFRDPAVAGEGGGEAEKERAAVETRLLCKRGGSAVAGGGHRWPSHLLGWCPAGARCGGPRSCPAATPGREASWGRAGVHPILSWGTGAVVGGHKQAAMSSERQTSLSKGVVSDLSRPLSWRGPRACCGSWAPMRTGRRCLVASHVGRTQLQRFRASTHRQRQQHDDFAEAVVWDVGCIGQERPSER